MQSRKHYLNICLLYLLPLPTLEHLFLQRHCLVADLARKGLSDLGHAPVLPRVPSAETVRPQRLVEVIGHPLIWRCRPRARGEYVKVILQALAVEVEVEVIYVVAKGILDFAANGG
jgi:hypothetical protein